MRRETLGLLALVAAAGCSSTRTEDPMSRTRTGFRVPSDETRRRAVGDLRSLPPAVARAFDPDGFQPIPDPDPGDWLAEHEEKAQTVAQFLESDPPRPKGARKKLVLAPLGPLERAPDTRVMAKIASAYFMLPVDRIGELDAGRMAPERRNNPSSGNLQLHAPTILDKLEDVRPDDALCLMALTEYDLYPQDDWNFVFGMASLSEGVGVHSFIRYYTPDADETLILRRSLKVMLHEVGHMLGLPHCVYYDCVMNGSNHLLEADRRTFHLCPVCLRKLHATLGFDPRQRYERLAAELRAIGLEADAAWIDRQLARL